MGRLRLLKQSPFAVHVDGLFFPQRVALGFDSREATPGFKRQLIILNGCNRRSEGLFMRQVGMNLRSWIAYLHTLTRLEFDEFDEIPSIVFLRQCI